MADMVEEAPSENKAFPFENGMSPDEWVLKHLWIIRYWKKMLTSHGVAYPLEIEDLLQEALIGLWKANATYKPARGTFLTHARWRVSGEIRHYLRKGIPRPLYEWDKDVKRATKKWHKKHAEPPPDEYIASELGISVEAHRELRRDYDRWAHFASMSDREERGPHENITATSSITSKNSVEEAVEAAAMAEFRADILAAALEILKEADQNLIRRHIVERETQTAIAAELRVSQPTISRRISKALAQMRSFLLSKGIRSRFSLEA